MTIWTWVDPHSARCAQTFDARSRCGCGGNIRPEAYRLSILLGAHSGLGLQIVWSEWIESPDQVVTMMSSFVATLGGNP